MMENVTPGCCVWTCLQQRLCPTLCVILKPFLKRCSCIGFREAPLQKNIAIPNLSFPSPRYIVFHFTQPVHKTLKDALLSLRSQSRLISGPF